MLRLLDGRRTSEVAALMGVKEVSVRSLVHRGLGKLRRMKSLARAITEAERHRIAAALVAICGALVCVLLHRRAVAREQLESG